MRGMVVILAAAAMMAMGAATSAPAVPAVEDAESQDEAQRLAKQKDLPAIALATKMKVVPAHGEPVEVDTAAAVEKVRKALTITKGPPSAGEQEYELQFYRGDELLRTVWVYPYGEWGFRRKGTGWTCGTSATLVPAIKEAVGAK